MRSAELCELLQLSFNMNGHTVRANNNSTIFIFLSLLSVSPKNLPLEQILLIKSRSLSGRVCCTGKQKSQGLFPFVK